MHIKHRRIPLRTGDHGNGFDCLAFLATSISVETKILATIIACDCAVCITRRNTVSSLLCLCCLYLSALNTWAPTQSLSFSAQKNSIASIYITTQCSKWLTIDRACWHRLPLSNQMVMRLISLLRKMSKMETTKIKTTTPDRCPCFQSTYPTFRQWCNMFCLLAV